MVLIGISLMTRDDYTFLITTQVWGRFYFLSLLRAHFVFDWLPCSRAVFLKLYCAYKSHRDLFKMQILIPGSWVRLEILHTSSLVIPILWACGPYLEEQDMQTDKQTRPEDPVSALYNLVSK